MINNRPTPMPFTSEVYKITFSSLVNSQKKYDLFLCYEELIEEEEIQNLKNNLNIEITGDGSIFEIINFTEDFSIQFDLEDSFFIENEYTKNGLIYFRKTKS
ncbi:hypothetical protein [Flavobacterium oreochromis]|uniref:Uncharacterized protein n=1 Tax=Flavobacterium oreochromis TaxID=2906078 RepID=A0ABW8P6N9_9FLAO|nr:hypothetical protein [Flavobacterium oreochromis]OWP78312.1 hypothetical protein BWG23_02230 [Flavobacterium oreochromis]POR25271.1 hypothetical protein BWK58_07105 [Flavobacterium columnare]QYS85554.1 hypothetical protein JJC03_10055 [Flavobacterium oreochromis]